MNNVTPMESVTVPPRYPCSVFYVDESAAKESSGNFFVVAAVKVRKPGLLTREIRRIRDEQEYEGEFKFSRITRGKLPIFCRLVDAMEASDAHIMATVVDRSLGNDPFDASEPEWTTHARITAKLLAGNIAKRELCSALMDERSTPVGAAFDDTVRAMTNQRLGATGLVSAVCVDSCTCDGVQLADLVAGAVALQRRPHKGRTNLNSHKAKIAARLASAFEVPDFADVRTNRVNVLTHGTVTGKTKRSKLTSLAG